MAAAQCYQLVGIYCVKTMLRYRFIVSKLNKLTLIYGLVLLIYMHYYRFGEPGKICSGDYLSGE